MGLIARRTPDVHALGQLRRRGARRRGRRAAPGRRRSRSVADRRRDAPRAEPRRAASCVLPCAAAGWRARAAPPAGRTRSSRWAGTRRSTSRRGELARVKSEHGNDAIYGGSYGWGSAGRFHHPQGLLHRFLNFHGGYTASVNSYSCAAMEVILPHVIGGALRRDLLLGTALGRDRRAHRADRRLRRAGAQEHADQLGRPRAARRARGAARRPRGRRRLRQRQPGARRHRRRSRAPAGSRRGRTPTWR